MGRRSNIKPVITVILKNDVPGLTILDTTCSIVNNRWHITGSDWNEKMESRKRDYLINPYKISDILADLLKKSEKTQWLCISSELIALLYLEGVISLSDLDKKEFRKIQIAELRRKGKMTFTCFLIDIEIAGNVYTAIILESRDFGHTQTMFVAEPETTWDQH